MYNYIISINRKFSLQFTIENSLVFVVSELYINIVIRVHISKGYYYFLDESSFPAPILYNDLIMLKDYTLYPWK